MKQAYNGVAVPREGAGIEYREDANRGVATGAADSAPTRGAQTESLCHF